MVDEKQLRNIASEQAKSKLERTASLADALKELMENSISPQWTRFAVISELWAQLLPPELLKHCKITNISGSRLKVAVDSPSYMHELRLCSSELLNQLRQQHSSVRIKKIDVVLG